ncbi:MAG: hypothetical protein ABIJ00_09830 [Candidatus Eisenbacteria bacterium]
MKRATLIAIVIAISVVTASGFSVVFAGEELPYYLEDRGPGVPLSMFGTYIELGEFIFYPFYEYYYDEDAEYAPADFGYGDLEDHRGKYRAHEGLIFLGYGVKDNLALELEAALITATQHKAEDDTSAMPETVEESGLGDVECQIRWGWLGESASRPGLFSYFETVFPLQKDKDLIGTQDWEFKLGTGLIKGFRWGTVTVRLAGEYSVEESKAEIGEYAVEYRKQVTESFRFYIGSEGSQDEVELIADLEIRLFDNGFLRINNGFGVTSKATDHAPEVGVLFRL